jgi:hypothetical protein
MISGCVQKETDVLKRSWAKGDVGMSDEFVLTHVAMSSGTTPAKSPPDTDPARPPEPPPTSGGDLGKIYRVTGEKEHELKGYVGQRVEIEGTFKHEEDARRELGTVGTTGRLPETAAEPTAANTAEITIDSIRLVSTSCVAR